MNHQWIINKSEQLTLSMSQFSIIRSFSNKKTNSRKPIIRTGFEKMEYINIRLIRNLENILFDI